MEGWSPDADGGVEPDAGGGVEPRHVWIPLLASVTDPGSVGHVLCAPRSDWLAYAHIERSTINLIL